MLNKEHSREMEFLHSKQNRQDGALEREKIWNSKDKEVIVE